MKVFNIVFILYFVFAAALQYNDPDPYVWIPIYLYAAFLCYQAIKNKYKPVLYYAGLIVYTVYAVYLFFDKTGVWEWASAQHAESLVQSMEASKPWIEEAREFFGLVIVIVVLLINMYVLRRRKN